MNTANTQKARTGKPGGLQNNGANSERRSPPAVD
jgi:hypothetical protein